MAQRTSFDKAIAQLYRDYLELLKAFGDFGKLVHEAAEDIALRQRLVRAPKEVLLEKGVPLPAGTAIEFLDNNSQRVHLILPALADKAPAVATPNPVKRAIARACSDAAYRALLINEPRRAFAQENCELPEAVEVFVRDMPKDKLLVVLPEHPDAVFGEQIHQLPKGAVKEIPRGLSLEWQGSTLVAAGRIDAITAPALRRELEGARVDIDLVLAAVTFLSSAGLGALLAGQKSLVAQGCNLRLVDVPEAVCTILETVGFIDLFEIIDRESQKPSGTDINYFAQLFLRSSTCTRAYGSRTNTSTASGTPIKSAAPIGGGGLISGIAVAIKETNPKIRIIGVEAAAMPGMHASLTAGKVITISSCSTIAEGIAVATVGSHTFPIVQKYVDDIVTVTEEEIANAILLLLEQEKTLVEGAGSVGFAALCNRKIQGVAGKNVAVIVSGGNIDLNMLSKILERGRVKDGRLTHLIVVLPDKPGSLVELSALLAGHRANVLRIIHERSFSQANLGEVQVSFTLETKGHQHVQEIFTSLAEKGFHLITA